MGKIDHDAVVRAQVLLLGTREPDLMERIGAYRVLGEVGPLTYLPKLSGALCSLGHDHALTDRPDLRLRYFAEALAIARRLGDDEPARKFLVLQALSGYERTLFALGRRAEGVAACAEMGAFEPARLAAVLAEEGRHGEAAALHEAVVRAEEAGQPHFSEARIAWLAELDAAGRREEALRVCAELVADVRRAAGAGVAPPGGLAQALSHQARMLDTAGLRAEARAARREALVVVAGTARGGEPSMRGRSFETWAGLLALSARGDEAAPAPGAPMPPLGTEVRHWSSDTREAFTASEAALEGAAVRLRAAGPSCELVTVLRRLAVRRALLRWHHAPGFAEEFGRLADEGVGAARRVPGDAVLLGRALTDRALFRMAAGRYAEAHADYAEAVGLLDSSPCRAPH